MSQATAHDAPDALTLACPAKVNLALAVGAPDDTGYHPIASWMVALSLADTLTLRPLSPGAASQFDIRFADDAPVAGTVDWPLEKDLAYRAHAALEQAVGRSLPVAVTLRKRIPTGAGLGGGSSDAAGMLVGLNALFELGLSEDALAHHAAALGSDVVFCIVAMRGAPAAIVTGRGERLQRVALREPIHLVLILPPLSCATGQVYAAFDEMIGTAPRAVDEGQMRALAEHGGRDQCTDDQLFNDLAEPACRVCPALRDARERVRAATGQRVHVTGSGAAMFVLAKDEQTAHQLAQRIIERAALPATGVRTIDTEP